MAFLLETAQTEITPVSSVYLAGYNIRKKPSQGVHDNLYAKSIYIENNKEAVKANNGLFYPTPPGWKKETWDSFPDAFYRFIKKGYKGEFEDKLLEVFNKAFLTSPPWEQEGYDHIRS